MASQTLKLSDRGTHDNQANVQRAASFVVGFELPFNQGEVVLVSSPCDAACLLQKGSFSSASTTRRDVSSSMPSRGQRLACSKLLEHRLHSDATDTETCTILAR